MGWGGQSSKLKTACQYCFDKYYTISHFELWFNSSFFSEWGGTPTRKPKYEEIAYWSHHVVTFSCHKENKAHSLLFLYVIKSPPRTVPHHFNVRSHLWRGKHTIRINTHFQGFLPLWEHLYVSCGDYYTQMPSHMKVMWQSDHITTSKKVWTEAATCALMCTPCTIVYGTSWRLDCCKI